MKALEIYHELQKDAYDLIFESCEIRNGRTRLTEEYEICDSEPNPMGLTIDFEDLGLETFTTLYRDLDLFHKHTLTMGWGIGSHKGRSSHERRQFLFKIARLMLDKVPGWYFDRDKLPLDMSNLESANLVQIEQARQFYTENTHLCPLSQEDDECDTKDLFNGEVSEAEAKLASEQEYYIGCRRPEWAEKPAARWKCSTHQLYLAHCLVYSDDPSRSFDNCYWTYRYATPTTSNIDLSLVFKFNQDQETYLDYLSRLESDVPTKNSILNPREPVPFGLLLEIQNKLNQEPEFFDYLFKKSEKNPNYICEVVDGKVCSCSSQSIFQDGCQCGASK